MTERLNDALQVTHVVKTYPDCPVLCDVTPQVPSGQILALCGENGAGKSTLLSIVSGLVPATSGEVRVFGEAVDRKHPPTSLGMVHQHFSLVPSLSVAENIFFAQPAAARQSALSPFKRGDAEAQTIALAQKLGFTLDPRAVIETLSVGEKQRVELMKAVRFAPKLLLLDEPTAVLAPHEITSFLQLLRTLREGGTTIVLVTHKLAEISAVCDRAVVLRKGELVLDIVPTPDAHDRIAKAMVGDLQRRTVPAGGYVREGEPALSVQSLSTHAEQGRGLQQASFTVAAGEIFGVSGVEGNGQSALFHALVGTLAATGDVTLSGQSLLAHTPHQRRALGMRAVVADRHEEGLLMQASLTDNLQLGNEQPIEAQRLLDTWDVRPPLPQKAARELSGGNQQKLLFARELGTAAPVKCLVVHEPSRGVDIKAKQSIWEGIEKCARDGAAVIVITSDLEELRALCARASVLYRGTMSTPFRLAEIDDMVLGRMLAGLARGDA